jgi:hypothetical protein
MFPLRSVINNRNIMHPTLLNPRWPKDSMRTLTLTLPPLNPSASRDSRVDVVGVCGDPPRPLHLQSNSAWQCELRHGTSQADKPRSDAFDWEPGSSPDLHLHPTLQPRQNDDSMRTPAPTLPPLNPIALCDSEQGGWCLWLSHWPVAPSEGQRVAVRVEPGNEAGG